MHGCSNPRRYCTEETALPSQDAFSAKALKAEQPANIAIITGKNVSGQTSPALIEGNTFLSIIEMSNPAAPNPVSPNPPADLEYDNAPKNLFRRILVNGVVVAKVYRSGVCETEGDITIPADFANEGFGSLEFAEKRALQLAKANGGTIEGAGIPETQQRWLDLSELENAIGNKADEDQSPQVRLAVPTEVIAPSLVTETA